MGICNEPTLTTCFVDPRRSLKLPTYFPDEFANIALGNARLAGIGEAKNLFLNVRRKQEQIHDLCYSCTRHVA